MKGFQEVFFIKPKGSNRKVTCLKMGQITLPAAAPLKDKDTTAIQKHSTPRYNEKNQINRICCQVGIKIA